MRHVRCPGCDKLLKVRDEIKASAVRCPACGEKISLDEPEVEELEEVEEVEAPREEGRPRPSAKGGPALPRLDDGPRPPRSIRRAPDEDDGGPTIRTRPRKRKKWHAMGTKWHGLLFLVIFVALSVFLLCLAFVVPRAGGALGLLGFVIAITGLVMAWGPLRRNGYGEDLAAVPYLLRGGGAFAYLLIRHAINAPRQLACWVFLLLFGIAMLITGSVIAGRSAATTPPPVVRPVRP